MRALSLLLRRAAVAGPSVPAETSALGSGLSGLERFFLTRTLLLLALSPKRTPPGPLLPPRDLGAEECCPRVLVVKH